MSISCKFCRGIGRTPDGKPCHYCNGTIRFSKGDVVEAYVEGSNKDDVAKVLSSIKSRPDTQTGWSENKKWIMSILASLIIGTLGWLGIQASSTISSIEPLLIKQVSPKDGTNFSHFPRTLMLEWESLPDTSRYVVLVQLQSEGKWHPLPNQDRFVTSTNQHQLIFMGAQPGRWKVSSIDNKEKILGESPWWYFKFSQ